MIVRSFAAVAFCLALWPSFAGAQMPQPRFSVSAGVRWSGGSSIGERDANETTSSGGSYRLFASDSQLGVTTALETSLGVRLFRLLHAQMMVSFGQVDLRSHLSSDVEGIPDTDVSESVGQLTIEGSALVDLTALELPRHTMPFVTAGGGYLRHLHEGRMLVESGSSYHVGAGLLMPFAGAAVTRAGSALRFDVKAMIRKGGAIPDDTPHVSPSVGASFVWNF